MNLHEKFIQTAFDLGIPLAGSVDLSLMDSEETKSYFKQQIARYDQWIASGYAGAMDYLVRGRDRRANPHLLFPEVQSIFSVALPYSKKPAGAKSSDQGPRYARYLQGRDYHFTLSETLQKLMFTLQREWDPVYPENPLKWKICVDTSAVLERTWTAMAGLGWIGKNTLLIHPKLGSYLFLGEVLINQKTGKPPSFLPNYCGHCTRCLDVCPTQALSHEQGLNSNQCISYITLEKRGDIAISEAEKSKIGPWIAGCDLCQEVCPFNFKPSRHDLTPKDVSEFQGDATLVQDWISLLSEDSSSYRLRVKNSALNRIKPSQFSRNLAIALMNSFDQMKTKAPDLFMRELKLLVEQKINTETDSFAKTEWEKCLFLFHEKMEFNPQISSHKS